MRFVNKIKCFISPLLIVDLLPNLVACAATYDDDINISIDDQNCIQYSNNTISGLTPTAYFTFQMSGIWEDDIFNILITRQDKDGEEGAFINIDLSSQYVQLNEGQESITIPFNLLSADLKEEIFEVHFSVVCTITRLNNIIFKTTINDLYFENATPNTRDMFEYQENNEGDKILVGWCQEPWVQQQLSKCNVLIIPDDVTEIADHAFTEPVAGAYLSTIPENIKCAYFDEGFGRHHNISKLRKIGNMSFWHSSHVVYKNITFPDLLSEIGEQAFIECHNFEGVLTFGPNMQTIHSSAFVNCGQGLTSLIFHSCCALKQYAFSGSCKNIQTIDLSAYGSTLPSDWDDSLLFESLSASTPENHRYVYISDEDDQQKWKDFLTTFNENFNTWIYGTKN